MRKIKVIMLLSILLLSFNALALAEEVAYYIEEKDGEKIIVLDWGMKPTAGYGIKIDRLGFDNEDNLLVYYALFSPGQNEMVAQVITNPKTSEIIPAKYYEAHKQIVLIEEKHSNENRKAEVVPVKDEVTYEIIFFKDEQIIVLNWGEKPSSGYEIEIVDFEMDEKNRLIVSYSTTSPNRGEPVMTVITNPTARATIPSDYLDYEEIVLEYQGRELLEVISDKISERISFLSSISFMSSLEKEVLRAREVKDRIFVQGLSLDYDVPPVIKEDRTLVPLRAISEGLGATVDWSEESRKVTIIKGEDTIVLPQGSKTVRVNGLDRELDMPAKLINNRTMVPLRFISEALGISVDYNEETGDIDIGLDVK